MNQVQKKKTRNIGIGIVVLGLILLIAESYFWAVLLLIIGIPVVLASFAKGKEELTETPQEEKKRHSKALVGILAVLVAGIIMSLALNSGSNTSQVTKEETQTPISNTLSIGEEGILNNNEDKSDCSGKTLLGVSKEALEASIDAQIVNDRTGYMELAGSGQIFFVENCTLILKLDIDGFLGSIAKVRILEHSLYGQQVGWVPYEFAVK